MNTQEKISMDKQYQTRDGRKVRVLAVDFKHDVYCVVVAVPVAGGAEVLYTYTATGCRHKGSPAGDDLIEIKPKHVMWVNVYPCRHPGAPTRVLADRASGPDRIACVRVEYAEGQFDEEPIV